MSESYSEQLDESRKSQRRASRPWLECYICQTPPTYERVKAHFESKGMLCTKADYEAVCEKMCVEPQYEKSPR